MEHLDAEALDAAAAGEPSQAARAHLARCPHCRAVTELAERLRLPPLSVPARVDRRILDMAAARLRRRRFPVRLAAAAVVVLAVALAFHLGPSERPPLPGDVDGSGAVDIVDAYLLATWLEQGSAAGPDVNGDGAVDSGDVRRIAHLSVALGGR